MFQHLEYFPFGETWVAEDSNIQRTPYSFTGKEFDEDTGLYYFGARYYEPIINIWLSTDPVLASYMGGKVGMGGIYNSLNLGMYTYGHLNPVNLVDPDGNTVYYVNGEGEYQKVEPKDYSKYIGIDVFVNGIRNGREGTPEEAVKTGINQLGSGNPFILVHNSSNGSLGDLAESAYNKMGGIPGIGRYLPSTQEIDEVAEVLKEIQPSTVTAHSQGALITVRACEQLGRSGEMLDGSLFTLNGAAVSKGKAERAINRIGGYLDGYNSNYFDPVSALTGTSLMDKVKRPFRTLISPLGFFNIKRTHAYPAE